MSLVVWYALNAERQILEQCEAPDLLTARLIFSVCCRGASYVQSRSSYDIAKLERDVPKHRRVKDEEEDDAA